MKKKGVQKPVFEVSGKAASAYPGPSNGPLPKRKRLSDASDTPHASKRRKLASPGVQYVVHRQRTARRQWLRRKGEDDNTSVEDLENQPLWVQRLLKEDIFTGANLGRKLGDFTRCEPGKEPPLPAPCQEALERLGDKQLRVTLKPLEMQPQSPVKRYLYALHQRRDTPLRAIMARSSPLKRLLNVDNMPTMSAKQRLSFSPPSPHTTKQVSCFLYFCYSTGVKVTK